MAVWQTNEKGALPPPTDLECVYICKKEIQKEEEKIIMTIITNKKNKNVILSIVPVFLRYLNNI